ncbi:MAG: type II 3-dehydroquinate dehydratase [Melioribacteraceae bacterium]|nr:type II 3-dehydroquinate dehydratase [Melioribacteraceae bacterium]
MKILVLNGPNLNLLGKRDKTQYGVLTLDDIEKILKDEFKEEYFEFFQSNHEGELIDKLHSAADYFDGVLINPGGYSHTSVAIRDALELCKIPKVEVHLSNISTREDFRHRTITAARCNGYVSGFKELSYTSGTYLLKKLHYNR